MQKVWSHFGAALTSFSMAILAIAYYPSLRTTYLRPPKTIALQEPQVQASFTSEESPLEVIRAEAASYGLNSRFSIAIPKLEAFSNIVPLVDPFNEASYLEALKNGVAHAKGTFFPGQGKTIYLFAHSTNSPANIVKYNAVFYQLRAMEVGDKIIIFYDERKFIYEVFDTKIVPAEDTSWLAVGEPETLILQTCDPPGTSLRRLLVLAKLL